jgi:hypothetical protein
MAYAPSTKNLLTRFVPVRYREHEQRRETDTMIITILVAANQSQTSPLESILNSYANVTIAIFTVAAVLLAALQFREAIRGADVKVHFADQALAFIGPSDLNDAERAIFFSVALVVVNEGPKVGVITNLRLKMLVPDPQARIRRPGGEEDANRFNYRFETEEATNAPVPALSVKGNSSETVRARCAIVRTSLSSDSMPPTADLLRTRVKIRSSYVKVSGKQFVEGAIDQEFALVGAFYDDAVIRSRREFLRM